MTELRFEVTQWLDGSSCGDEEERATIGSLRILAGGQCLTTVYDPFEFAVRDTVNVGVAPLAEWLLWNRWRILHEPDIVSGTSRRSTGWRQSHELGAVGRGYLWPSLSLVGDGASVRVVQKPDPPPGSSGEGGIRYLAAADLTVPQGAIDLAIDELVETTRDRLLAVRGTPGPLDALAKVVAQERNDPESDRHRTLEARLGLDPDEVDAALVTALAEKSRWIGPMAADEVLADAGWGQVEHTLDALLTRRNRPDTVIDLASLSGVEVHPTRPAEPPWLRGVMLARALRKHLSLGNSPVDLDELVGARVAGPCHSDVVAPHLGAAFRLAGESRYALSLGRRSVESRRFALARLLCDHLIAPREDQVLPATRTATVRQKVQRAFAQEFLAPIDGLREQLAGSDGSEDARQDAASYYRVSARVVDHALENHLPAA